MNKLFAFFLPFFGYEIETTLSKKTIKEKIAELEPYDEAPYHSSVSEDGFKVWLPGFRKFSSGLMLFGYVRNNFAPIFSAKLEDKDGKTLVKATLRMNTVVNVIILPIYFLLIAISALELILLPISLTGAPSGAWEIALTRLSPLLMVALFTLLLHFAFKRPAKKLAEYVEKLLVYYENQQEGTL